MKFGLIISLFLIFSRQLFACECARPESITNLKELNQYDFIAVVKIDDIEQRKNQIDYGYDTGLIKVSIVELFKGKEIKYLYDLNMFNSCSDGIQKGTEWLVFAFRDENKYCLHACDRNSKYRDTSGFRVLEFLDIETDVKTLRKLFNHVPKKVDYGVQKSYFQNGKPEHEAHYQDGQMHGKRSIWYPNGQLDIEENYKNGELNSSKRWYENGQLRHAVKYPDDTLNGKRVWYFETGQIDRIEFRSNGKIINKAVEYADTSADEDKKKWLIQYRYKTEEQFISQFKKIRITHEEIYGINGELLIGRKFHWNGNIWQEKILLDNNAFLVIKYFENGNVKESYKLNKQEIKTDYQDFSDDNKFADQEE